MVSHREDKRIESVEETKKCLHFKIEMQAFFIDLTFIDGTSVYLGKG